MDDADCRNRRNLRLVRPERTPEEWLDLEFAEEIAAIRLPRGRRRPSRFYKVAEGQRHPLRVPARLIDDAVRARIPGDVVAGAIYKALKRYIARKARLPLPETGEFTAA